MNRTPDAGYLQNIINSMPVMIFVVDADVAIHDLNTAAAITFNLDRSHVMLKRSGEVLHCLHSTDMPGGCGRGPHCGGNCVIRKSVGEAMAGHAIQRSRMRINLVSGSKSKEMDLLVTAAPLEGSQERLALLILEDITEVSLLRGLLPICAKCKKVRSERDYWRSVEQYFNEHLGIDFSHGLCPDCLNAELKHLDEVLGPGTPPAQ